MKLRLAVYEVDDTAIIECGGRITYRQEAEALSVKVAELLRDSRQFVIDLSEVEVVDAAGLGAMVKALMMVRSHEGTMVLASPSRQIRSLFKLTNLDRVLDVYPSRQEALLASREAVA